MQSYPSFENLICNSIDLTFYEGPGMKKALLRSQLALASQCELVTCICNEISECDPMKRASGNKLIYWKGLKFSSFF
ncbi:hypothetical protein ZYGR_0R00870 [Zygosaccharomyces rouxii]|uniref:ZYRO0F02046p n=2 Tax=Zygosaccharomyces rouxii TaxID=4956 RepID=C5DX41_ZYGRC|nr:uncharacterized protein ZYRO0F02046g [Zygosaccharomyces rouxii]GAV49844.1 hypothetical protein ZYGR_0R00870 [Zygosaccharomyces rouxii]CAR28352.1 ZYRO0F02046p [Zygosaccharomyces rouxii]